MRYAHDWRGKMGRRERCALFVVVVVFALVIGYARDRWFVPSVLLGSIVFGFFLCFIVAIIAPCRQGNRKFTEERPRIKPLDAFLSVCAEILSDLQKLDRPPGQFCGVVVRVKSIMDDPIPDNLSSFVRFIEQEFRLRGAILIGNNDVTLRSRPPVQIIRVGVTKSVAYFELELGNGRRDFSVVEVLAQPDADVAGSLVQCSVKVLAQQVVEGLAVDRSGSRPVLCISRSTQQLPSGAPQP